MKRLNRFGEVVHEVCFDRLDQARGFTKMLGCNDRRFALVGLRREGPAWLVTYRARKESPWQRDQRGRKAVA